MFISGEINPMQEIIVFYWLNKMSCANHIRIFRYGLLENQQQEATLTRTTLSPKINLKSNIYINFAQKPVT